MGGEAVSDFWFVLCYGGKPEGYPQSPDHILFYQGVYGREMMSLQMCEGLALTHQHDASFDPANVTRALCAANMTQALVAANIRRASVQKRTSLKICEIKTD